MRRCRSLAIFTSMVEPLTPEERSESFKRSIRSRQHCCRSCGTILHLQKNPVHAVDAVFGRIGQIEKSTDEAFSFSVVWQESTTPGSTRECKRPQMRNNMREHGGLQPVPPKQETSNNPKGGVGYHNIGKQGC